MEEAGKSTKFNANLTAAFVERHKFPFCIQAVPNQGRCAVATRNLALGEVVLACPPYGVSVDKAFESTVCAYCFVARDNTSLGDENSPALRNKCTNCRDSAFYCSHACKSSHAFFHVTYECSRLLELATVLSDENPTFTAVLSDVEAIISKTSQPPAENDLMQAYSAADIYDIARWILDFCIRRELDEELASSKTNSHLPTYGHVMELISNELLIYDRRMNLQIEGLHVLFCALSTHFSFFTTTTNLAPTSQQSFSTIYSKYFTNARDLSRVMAIRQINGFGLWHKDGTMIGQALYPTASFFNHSCDMNLERSALNEADGPSFSLVVGSNLPVDLDDTVKMIHDTIEKQPPIVFRAARNIAEGELLTHGYIDVGLSAEGRRQELQEVYGFECANGGAELFEMFELRFASVSVNHKSTYRHHQRLELFIMVVCYLMGGMDTVLDGVGCELKLELFKLDCRRFTPCLEYRTQLIAKRG
ncbi:hypothetical protein HDU78_002264 [Chytriomyces hyalinus]|nr:hypothetical protein HDU78_002264 [Chytriomyces hyalinus]